MQRRKGTIVEDEDPVEKTINFYNLKEHNPSIFCKNVIKMLTSVINADILLDILRYNFVKDPEVAQKLYPDLWSKIWHFQCIDALELILTQKTLGPLFKNVFIRDGTEVPPDQIIPNELPFNYLLKNFEVLPYRIVNILINLGASVEPSPSTLANIFTLPLETFQLLITYMVNQGVDLNECWVIQPIQGPSNSFAYFFNRPSKNIKDKIKYLVETGKVNLNSFSCTINPDLESEIKNPRDLRKTRGIQAATRITIFGNLLINLIRLYKQIPFSLKNDQKKDIIEAIGYMLNKGGANPRGTESESITIHTQGGPMGLCEYIINYDRTNPPEIKKLLQTKC